MNYLGFDSPFEQAAVIFWGIPFDGTASFRAGSRFAPDAVRRFSVALETYSPYQNLDVSEHKICDFGDFECPLGNTTRVMQLIESKADSLLQSGKKLLTCGGEHLITYPIVQSYFKKYPEIYLIQLDAHADLREHYLGEKLSHATVIRLISGFIEPKKIFQYGIRSGEKEEFEWAQKNTNFFPFEISSLQDIEIPYSAPVYLTLDLDVLDPSVLPGTGTPEPGGVSFQELLQALLHLKKFNVVGADIVELAPDYDSSGISTAVAAKLIREIALLLN